MKIWFLFNLIFILRMPKELCLKSNSDWKVECCNTSESDAVFKFEDCFSLEILRPSEHCWPQQTNQQSFPIEMGPVHRGWLKEFDNFPSINLNKVDMEYYDHAFVSFSHYVFVNNSKFTNTRQ
jgi:hypothetical protein